MVFVASYRQKHLFYKVNQKDFYHITDNQLLDNFYESRDNRLLGILLQRYTLLLFGVCMKYLKQEEKAKDAVQQIFLKVIGELQRYKVDYFKSWLYMVARNHCFMYLRAKNIHISKKADDSLYLTGEDTDWQQYEEKDKLLTVMETSLEELKDDQKTCVTLFYLQKKSYQEIVEITGFSLPQVKSYIQNGKRNLKILVEKKMDRS